MKKIAGILHAIKSEINPGLVLLFTTVAAMIIANSPLSDLYSKLFEETKITIDFNLWSLSKPLYYWINDGLMAVFFFLVGLEIKREILIGGLSQPKKALLPIVAAAGGMAVPALLFITFNLNDANHINGWAIPMATDIAFALGILALLKSRVPVELKIFITTLAIVDDIGAVITIAAFYTSDISVFYLLAALVGWVVLFVLNKAGVRVFWVFILIGILGVWYPLLKSGVHATVAGILVAFTIPIDRKYDISEFTSRAGEVLKRIRENSGLEEKTILKTQQYEEIEKLKTYCEKVSSPLQNLEHGLHNFTFYFIMPLFAFANTGIRFKGIDFGSLISNNLSIGIFTGLFLGKVAGILLFVWIFHKLRLVSLPKSLNWNHIIGAGFLAGIGFTMSIFITDLAFHGDELIVISKLSILIASLLAGITGYFILRRSL
ncbi:MAG: Na+/H+ antiporter NhaA [Prolixibacteraceae bacterium]|nr:Na+/H+ antiporter NhaA [Prolixibacteraceae bacterium]MBN2773163.1 Na+/H+ antiporter NhaA [Prolixibacteraceae bacterium]